MSGAPGNDRTGGAAATIIGYLSGAPGTEFLCEVAAAPTYSASTGNASNLRNNDAVGSLIATANGGQGYIGGMNHPAATASSGSVSDTTRVISYYVVPGGGGSIYTDAGDNSSAGAASFWGASPAPGAGGGSIGNKKPANSAVFGQNFFGLQPGAGLIKFEWN